MYFHPSPFLLLVLGSLLLPHLAIALAVTLFRNVWTLPLRTHVSHWLASIRETYFGFCCLLELFSHVWEVVEVAASPVRWLSLSHSCGNVNAYCKCSDGPRRNSWLKRTGSEMKMTFEIIQKAFGDLAWEILEDMQIAISYRRYRDTDGWSGRAGDLAVVGWFQECTLIQEGIQEWPRGPQSYCLNNGWIIVKIFIKPIYYLFFSSALACSICKSRDRAWLSGMPGS